MTSNDSTTTTTTTNTTTTTENNSNSTQIEPKTDETEAEKNKQTDGEKNKDDNKVMEITSTDTGSAKESSDVATTPSIINKSLCTSDRCFCRMNHYECGLNCLCGCPKDGNTFSESLDDFIVPSKDQNLLIFLLQIVRTVKFKVENSYHSMFKKSPITQSGESLWPPT